MKELELSKLKPDEKAIIKEINLQGKLKYRLLELGIVENTELKLIKYAPLGDPIQISIRGYNLAMRKETAKKIKIEKLDEWRKQW
ncbi:MAG: ferrous iron transport protein A [Clostridia bacterium]|jgi:Fe2+ transport system protein FeoA|nr:ferrous iron transport protein A [Clostridia bacterium]